MYLFDRDILTIEVKKQNSKNYKLFSAVSQTQIKDQDQSSINKSIINTDNLSNKLINFVKKENERIIG